MEETVLLEETLKPCIVSKQIKAFSDAGKVKLEGLTGSDFTSGTTILDAIKQTVDPATKIVYNENPDANFIKRYYSRRGHNALPTTLIASGRSTTKIDAIEVTSLDSENLPEFKPSKPNEVSVMVHQSRGKDETDGKSNARASNSTAIQQSTFWQSQLPSATHNHQNQNISESMDIDALDETTNQPTITCKKNLNQIT
ncbi:hypothetical protein KIW84_064528 [Lathyrus oleraceus]|uniref:Uncharacterized protein n=1 Tax=Pisum sativum TaxID=3888 RepID=A0A9D4WAG0_PEA|nr:hypothetical protein KIW84_064528 [Pisum sativum]